MEKVKSAALPALLICAAFTVKPPLMVIVAGLGELMVMVSALASVTVLLQV
jgi:hypothetical protein